MRGDSASAEKLVASCIAVDGGFLMAVKVQYRDEPG
jgi:hypothetical protein